LRPLVGIEAGQGGGIGFGPDNARSAGIQQGFVRRLAVDGICADVDNLDNNGQVE